MLPSTRLLCEEASGPRTESSSAREQTSRPVPSIVVDDVDGNDDDPPPYSAIAPPNHVGWTYDFSGIPYSARAATPCRTEPPLAPFQTSLTSGFPPEGANGQQTSISMPLMPCRMFKFGSHGSLFANRGLPFTDNISVTKDDGGRRRKYGGILIAGAVILFLMVLSLLVRLVMEKSLWRG